MIRFFVPGIPAPQGSKRHVGRGILVESSKQLKPWRLDVTMLAQAAHHGDPLDEATVAITFVFPRPRKHYRTGRHAHELRTDAPHRHTTKPDIDKLARAVLDALTAAGVIRDDSRVADLHVTKRYGDQPGAHIEVADGVFHTTTKGAAA